LIAPLLEQESAELVDLAYVPEAGKMVLRLFVDKEGGVTLDDCAYLSERVGALIDEKNIIDRSYVLEVSSPGLDRVVKKDKDFERFAGQTVKVRLKAPENGRKRFTGVLRGLKDGKVVIVAGESTFEFTRELVDEVRLDYEAEV